MNLSEFSNNLCSSEKEANLFMSNMLGFFTQMPKNIKQENAILELFESFPETYKKNKNLWEEYFLKFFNLYEINENNIKYYHQYITKHAYQAKIIFKNKHWEWDKKDSEINYNNIREFCKAFDIYAAKHTNEEILSFLKDHIEQLKKLHKKITKSQTEKIAKSIGKVLLKIDYKEYKNIFNSIGMDHKKLFLILYGDENYYGFGSYLQSLPAKIAKNEIINALNDLFDLPEKTDIFEYRKNIDNAKEMDEKIHTIFSKNKSFLLINNQYQFNNSLMLTILSLISKDDGSSGIFAAKYFEKYFFDYITSYIKEPVTDIYNLNNDDKSQLFKRFLTNIINNSIHNDRHSAFSPTKFLNIEKGEEIYYKWEKFEDYHILINNNKNINVAGSKLTSKHKI